MAKKPVPRKPKAAPRKQPKPAAKARPKAAAKAKPAVPRKKTGPRPKAVVFAVDEIPQVARMADAFAIPPAVRRSPVYFYPSEFGERVKLPPDRVCTEEEEKVGHAFLTRLAIDLYHREWKDDDVFPMGHTRAWHDVPVDVLTRAFERCGFDVVGAAAVMDLAGYAEEEAAAAKLATQTPTAKPIPDLVFADLFGFTRISPDGKVTTDPKLTGDSLSIDRDGRLGLLLKEEGRVRVVIELATRRELGALDKGLMMHPTGAAVVWSDAGGFYVKPLKRSGAPAAGKLQRNVFPEGGAAHPLRLLDGDSIELEYGEALAFDEAGNYVAWFGDEINGDWERPRRSALFAGRFASAGEGPSIAWRVELRGPELAQLSVSIVGGVPVACVRDVVTSKVAVAVFSEDGIAHVRTIDCVTMPSRVGQTLVYQPDETTVVREPLAGGTATRHMLSGRAAGRGRVVSRGERWLYVPEHGETLIDFEDGGREHDRGLPAKQAKTRAAALDVLAKIRTIVADAGMDVSLSKLEAGQNGYMSCGLRVAGGGPVLGNAVRDAILSYASDILHGAVSIGGRAGVLQRPATYEEIVELLRVFHRHRLQLAWAQFSLNDFYLIPFTRDPPLPARIEPRAEALLLAAVLDEAVPPAEAAQDFEAKLAAWKKHTPTPEVIAERLMTLDDDLVNQRHHLIAFIAWMTTGRFGREAVDLWLSIPEPRLRFMGATAPLTALAKRDKTAFKQLARWFKTLRNPHMNWNQLRDVLGVPPSAEQEAEEAEQKSREPVAAPTGFDKKVATWDAIASDWAGAREIHGMAKLLEGSDPAAIAKQLGVPALPPSYLEFIKRFFVIGELRQRYTHDKFPYFLNLVAPSHLVGERRMFLDSLGASADISVKLRQAREDLGGLLPFGTDTSRTWICWDPANPKPDGEMLICFIDGDEIGFGEARTDVGYDLKQVLKYFQPGTFDERD